MKMKRVTLLFATLVILGLAALNALAGAAHRGAHETPTLAATERLYRTEIGGSIGPGTGESAVGNSFTYQGRLLSGGSPANGQYDLRFALYDAATGGSQVGTPVVLTNQTVSNGLFSVTLDFGAPSIRTSDAWLAWASSAGTRE
jgi:hypothetical protein